MITITRQGCYVFESVEQHAAQSRPDRIEVFPFATGVSMWIHMDIGLHSESSCIRLTPSQMREMGGLLNALADKIEGKF